MQNEQLINYIKQCTAQGMQPNDIRTKLIQGGWQPSQVDMSLAQSGYTMPPAQQTVSTDPHRIRKGVLWILSPCILFFMIALLQFVVKFALGSSAGVDVGPEAEVDTTASTADLVTTLVNIFSLLAGIVAVVLIPVGFIIGIIKITKK